MSSLKDLARECGVSVATVSKALNGQHDISDATRARVREAAERLGYVLFYYIEEALQYEDKNAIWRLFPEAFG